MTAGIVLFGMATLIGCLVVLLRPAWQKHNMTERMNRAISKMAAPPPRPHTQALRSTAPAVPAVTVSFDPSAVRAKTAAAAGPTLEWLGTDERVVIQGVTIPSPMTYRVFRHPSYGREEPSAIDPQLPVARNAYGEPPLLYWPSYSAMTPGQRRIYLDWMANGRQAMPAEVGYAFTFFYGLERRALIDNADHAVIFSEVFRLRRLNGDLEQARFSRSFESYSSSLLWYMVISLPDQVSDKTLRLVMESTRHWNEDTLSAALAWFIVNGRPVPDWAAFVVAGEMPSSRRSVVTSRVEGEFRKLFAKRYAEQFGTGLQLVSSARRDRLYSYRPASAALQPQERRGPHSLELTNQLKLVSDVWNECIKDLRRLSSLVCKPGHEDLTAETWEAMPTEIRAGVEHPLTDAVCNLVNESTDDQGRTRIPVGRLAQAVLLESRERLTVAQSRKVCETVEYVGYGLEPDARLTGKAYRSDEHVAAFLKSGTETTDPTRYNAAACFLRLGILAAQADNEASTDEVSLVTQTIDEMFQLNGQERRRLESLRALLLVDGCDTAGIAQIAESLRSEQRQAVAKLLLLVVARDGVVTKQELRALTKCYALLGFSKAEYEQALATIQSYRTDRPVTIQASAPAAPGEAVPAPPKEGLRLDRKAIEAIMRDTQEVAKLLADAMNVGQASAAGEAATSTPAPPVAAAASASAPEQTRPEAPQSVVPTVPPSLTEPLAVTTTDPTLPERYAAFYQMLITRDEWSRSEIEALARQHGLMLGGAVDALNDWAFEKFGGQLFVDDGARLTVQREYLN